MDLNSLTKQKLIEEIERLNNRLSDLDAVSAGAERREASSRGTAEHITHMSGGVIIETPERKVLQVNAKFCELFGIDAPPEALNGADCQEAADQIKQLFSDSEGFVDRIDQIIAAGETVQQEELQLVDGRVLERDYTPVEVGRGLVEHLWHYHDITEQKRVMRIQAAQLRLVEYAVDHSIQELLQKFLDDAEALTGSEIGFYHFVEDDQLRLRSQTWSSNTLKNMCNLEGEGKSYAIADAGIWVDCVGERRPVVHNDYAAFPHKKGLPEGHAPLVRELVVPVIRGDRIMAILGVGNKQTDYSDSDVNTVQQLADLAWETVIRKQTDEARLETEVKYRSLVEDSPIAIAVHSAGTIIYINPVGLRLIGAEREEEILGRSILDVIHPDYHQIVLNRVKQQYEQRESVPSIEEKFVRLDGRIIDVEVTGTTITYQGQPASQVIIQDITERKEAERALSESEEKYRQLIQNSGDAIYLLYDRRFEVVNEKFEEMFGLTLEDVNQPDFDFMNLVAPESRPLIEERGVRLEAGEEVEPKYEFTAINADGVEIEVETSVTYIKHEEGVATQGIIRDITERKRLEQQLRQAQKMEAVGRLAGGIAHDFNNLLTVINGYAELLMSEQLPEKVSGSISQIKNAGERAARLTGQLLAFSRKQIVQPEIINLNKLIPEQMKMLSRLLSEDIEIITRLTPDLPQIEADPVQIEQIIMNIAINARDAMPFGGRLTFETASVEFDADYLKNHAEAEPGQFVMLAISDTGVGMDEATRGQVFEPFFTTKGREKGTGLGLATVYGIVKQNRGFVYVYSELQKGTTFKIYLPVAEKDEGVIMTNRGSMDALQGSETILLVEDDPDVREVTRTTLTDFGYQLLTAVNGEEVLHIFEENRGTINLLLTDVVMPRMSGRELADQLAIADPKLKILYCSGYTDNSIAQHGVLEKGMEFIQKPYTAVDLARKVRSVLDK